MERVVRLAKEFCGYERLGISTAGQINPHTGEVILYTDSIPGYRVQPETYFEAALGIPVAVDNDANCMAMGNTPTVLPKAIPTFSAWCMGPALAGHWCRTAGSITVPVTPPGSLATWSPILEVGSANAASRDAMKLTPLPLPSPASWRRGPGRPFWPGDYKAAG